MSQLDQAQGEWLELFFRLRSELADVDLAAPFLSIPPAGYDSVGIPSVLYVGKATAGDWDREDFLETPTLHERRARTTSLLDDDVKTGSYRSAFWNFALKLSAQLAKINSITIEPLQNLVWTNISKIGQCSSNPGKSCYSAQRELSVRTLQLEIREYRPSLIVFVTGDYGNDIIGEIACDPEEDGWHKQSDEVWWRLAANGLPPIFWMPHPQGKSREKIDGWLEKLSSLAVPGVAA